MGKGRKGGRGEEKGGRERGKGRGGGTRRRCVPPHFLRCVAAHDALFIIIVLFNYIIEHCR